MRIPEALLTRDVLLSLLLVGSVSLALGAGTWAFLQDTDRSQENALVGGTLDLKLDGADTATAAFGLTDAKPTDSASHNFTITNEGDVAADHVELSFGFAENDTGVAEPTDTDLYAELNGSETASLIKVTQFEYRNDSGAVVEDLLSGVSDENGNGVVDLQDVQSQGSSLDGLPAPQPNGANATYLVIAVEIVNDDGSSFVAGGNIEGNLTGYDEDFMGDGVNVTIKVTLNQDASQ